MRKWCILLCFCIMILMQGCSERTNSQESSGMYTASQMHTSEAQTEEPVTEMQGGAAQMEETASSQASEDTTEDAAVTDYSYDADAWISPEGKLDYPFDQKELLYSSLRDEEKAAAYRIPQEALDRASTADLIALSCNYIHVSGYSLFDQMGYFMDYMNSEMAALQEAAQRGDYAEALLQVYQELALMPLEEFEDEQEQKAYEEEAYIRDGGITLCEILLAEDETFEKMTDDTKAKVLEEVVKKLRQRENGQVVSSLDGESAFFIRIQEIRQEQGTSGWYSYIEETAPDYMTYIQE